MSNNNHQQIMEKRKSRVRVIVTYGAASFLFVGGTAFIIVLMSIGHKDDAIDLFNTLLPVGAAIVSFWFAGRAVSKPNRGNQDNPGDNEAGDEEGNN